MVGRPAMVLAAVMLAALTPASGLRAAGAQAVQINLSLDRYAKVAHLAEGDSVGIAPPVVTVHVGDAIVFVNDDATAHHTATGLPGATRFSEPRWSAAALKPSGSLGPAAWSTGDIAPGAKSAVMVASTPGTFLYGCFFHYSAGMRGEIIVQP